MSEADNLLDESETGSPGRPFARIGSRPIPDEAVAIEEAELGHAPSDFPTPPTSVWRERLIAMAAISAGGSLGAICRYLVGRWAVDRWGSAFPWGTLAINLSGSFVLGFYLTLITERFSGRATARLFVATGFLGAFTTFSTFSYETVHLVQHDRPIRALVYVIASIAGGLAAAASGVAAAESL